MQELNQAVLARQEAGDFDSAAKLGSLITQAFTELYWQANLKAILTEEDRSITALTKAVADMVGLQTAAETTTRVSVVLAVGDFGAVHKSLKELVQAMSQETDEPEQASTV